MKPSYRLLSSLIIVTSLGFLGMIQVATAAPIPADAQRFLDSLPQKKITVDVVLGLGVYNSDQGRKIKSQELSKDVAYLKGSAPLSWRLEAEASRLDDNSAFRGFAAERTEVDNYRLGISKYLQTGSSISAELTNSDTRLTFPSAFTSNASFASFIGETEFSEPRLTLSLAQNLWKDAFGSATRKSLEASKKQKELVELQVKQNFVDLSMGLVEIFYQAWLAQAQVQADRTNLARQQRLLKITKIQARRGTAERADLLQVHSAVKLAEQTLSDSKQIVNQIYKNLVVTLGLPIRWMSIDGELVPTGIDQPVGDALKLCQLSWKEVAIGNSKLTQLKQQLSVNETQLEAAKAQMAPQLQLQFSAGSNGLDQDLSQAFEDASSWQNPRYVVGLQFQMPLDLHAEKADSLMALTEKTVAEFEYQQTRGDLQAQWANTCEDLKRLTTKVDEHKQILRLQQERALLEEKRFKIGRVSALNVIQAGRDATQAEIGFKATEVEVRKAAWAVKRLSGEVEKEVKRLATSELLQLKLPEEGVQ